VPDLADPQALLAGALALVDAAVLPFWARGGDTWPTTANRQICKNWSTAPADATPRLLARSTSRIRSRGQPTKAATRISPDEEWAQSDRHNAEYQRRR